MTEREKKMLLTKDDYDFLCACFGNQKPRVKQINYYYDTSDLVMNRQSITCRIRLKDGKFKATMKKHSANAEESIETDLNNCTDLEHNAFTEMGLKLMGVLITERCVIGRAHGCEVVLDRNEYLGHSDYELEIEYTAEHGTDAQTILEIVQDLLRLKACLTRDKAKGTLPGAVPCKSQRFFAAMIDEQGNAECSDGWDADDYVNSDFDAVVLCEHVCQICVHFRPPHCTSPSGTCRYELS